MIYYTCPAVDVFTSIVGNSLRNTHMRICKYYFIIISAALINWNELIETTFLLI